MALFKKRKQEDFKKAKIVGTMDPEPEIVSEVKDESIVVIAEPQIPEAPVPQPVPKVVPVGQTETLEELEARGLEVANRIQTMKDIKEAQKKKEEPKVFVKRVVISKEEMFNDLSDRLDGIENYLFQLDKFMREK